jgi:hypothetical protein
MKKNDPYKILTFVLAAILLTLLTTGAWKRHNLDYRVFEDQPQIVSAIAAGDFDGDGVDELVLSELDQFRVTILKWQDGEFKEVFESTK